MRLVCTATRLLACAIALAGIARATGAVLASPTDTGASAQTATPDAATLNAIRARIAPVAVLRGVFSQEKHLAGFRNPLRSQGRFLLVRERGVRWTTLTPFPSEMVVTHDRILTRQRDGSSRVEVDARQQPALRSINTLLFALMGGDLAALMTRFELQSATLDALEWQVTLRPRPGALAQVFTRITLAGDGHVRHVALEESNGDRTAIAFSQLAESPVQLSPDEARGFE